MRSTSNNSGSGASADFSHIYQHAADYDKDALKRELNLAAVVQSYGTELHQEGERLVGLCPFHEDSRPSFAVWQWPEGDWAVGCWACGFGPGDVFDFLEKWHGIGFRDALLKAIDLKHGDLPDAPELVESNEPAPDLGGIIEESRRGHGDALVQLLVARGIEVPADWLRAEFGVGISGARVVIPHYNEMGEPVGVKHRSEEHGWVPLAVRGSKLDSLYGVWRAQGHKAVVLCEGESDTWTVAYLMRGEAVSVLGLPSGVSAQPRTQWLEVLRNRDVILLFDADRAGRDGTKRWVAALYGVARSIRVAGLPDGSDATSAGEALTGRAIREAWVYVHPATLPVARDGNRYVRRLGVDKRTDEEKVTVLSDFVMDIERLVAMDTGGVVYEVQVPGNVGTQFLTDAELSSGDRLRGWAARRNLSWKGSARDVSDLLEVLKSEATFVPRVHGTNVIGLHGEAFVLPGEVVGKGSWAYVPPPNDVNFGAGLKLEPQDDWTGVLPLLLTQLHSPEVITPILGWVAAAPLRSLVRKFPVLAVVGGSGWGKTTLVETVLRSFGFWCVDPVVLGSTTRHGVQSYAGATNAFPVWFDEFRRNSCREDTRFAIEQVLRDAWDGSSSVKGGLQEDRMKVTFLPARAPIIVTGEDLFSEVSHTERMVLISIPKHGRDRDALWKVQHTPAVGLGRAYLMWLLSLIDTGTLPAPPDILDRPKHAQAVAEWGYELLTQFSTELLNTPLPPFDDTLIVHQHENAAAQAPIIEAIREAIDVPSREDRHPVAYVEGSTVYVRLTQLCYFADQNHIPLPGGREAVTEWLKQEFPGARRMRPYRGGSKLPQYIKLPDAAQRITGEIQEEKEVA